MAMSISGMADGIQDELWNRLDPGDPAKRPTKAELRDLAESIATGVINHIVAYMEIKGVETAIETPAQTVEVYAAGVGDQGGSLIAAGPPGAPLISGIVKHGLTQNMTAKQTNDGTGRVL